jgi:hypothetical protein
MAYGKDKINEVRKLYVFDRFSLDKASGFANVSYATCQRWKKEAKAQGDDWDKLRAAHTMASGDIEDLGIEILTNFIVTFKSAMEELKENPQLDPEKKVKLLASVSDSYVKAVSANQKTMPTVSKLAVAFEVLDKFKDYVMQNAPEIAPKFAEMLVPFGEQMEKELK